MNAIGSTPPAWFRIVAGLALLWNLFGLFIYLHNAGVFGDPLADLDRAGRAFAATIPPWVGFAHAIAAFAGTVGVIGLLLGRRWARGLLFLSLLAILAQCGWLLLISGAVAAYGPSVAILSGGAIMVGILLAWLAQSGVRRGWLS